VSVPDAEERWSALLDTYEFRIGSFAATLVGAATPESFTMPTDLGPCPPALRSRANLIIDRQHDVENAMRFRLGVLRTLLDGSEPAAPGSVYIDASA
jgi:hypothetical protein